VFAPLGKAQGGIGIDDFIQAVMQGNIGLAAQKFNIDIADAAIAVAGLPPDPTITIGYNSYELSRFRLPNSTGITLNYLLENPDKRNARVVLAEAEKSLAQAQVAEYMNALRVDAATAFFEALRANDILKRRQTLLSLFEELERKSINASKKPATPADELAQLRLELARLRGDLIQAESDLFVANRNLNFYLGQSKFNDPQVFAKGRLDIREMAFDGPSLEEGAYARRGDLESAEKALDAANAKSKLARENRKLDLGLTIGVTHTQPLWGIPDAGGTYTPGSYPISNGLVAAVSIPIPFSLAKDGDLRGPAAAAAQSEIRLRDLRAKVRIEVQQALMKYRLSVKQVAALREGTKQADILMQDTLAKFAGGVSGFPDIVYYVRTANEIHMAYLEALASSAKALVSVYQTSGTWQAIGQQEE